MVYYRNFSTKLLTASAGFFSLLHFQCITTIYQCAATRSLKNGCFQAYFLVCQSCKTSFIHLDTQTLRPQQVIWAVSLSTMDLGTHCLTLNKPNEYHSELIKTWLPKRPLIIIVALQAFLDNFNRSTEIDFVDNQLSPNLFSLSLLSINPKKLLQQLPLRSSFDFLNQIQPVHGKLVWLRVYFQLL